MFWSALDVNELCIQANLPHTGGEFDTNWERTDLGEAILFVVTFVMIVSLSTIFRAYGWMLNRSVYLISLILSSLLIIYNSIKYVIKKRNGTWY